MRFVDLLKTTVLLSAGAATTLAALAIGRAQTLGDQGTLVLVLVAWWCIAAISGVTLGRERRTTPAIARLLADAKPAQSLTDPRTTAVVLNRLWPLLVSTLIAAGLAFVAPQIPGVAAGFPIIWALAWRRQDAAVSAIEERDGVTFYVERTSPVRAMTLVRAPGFRRDRSEASLPGSG